MTAQKAKVKKTYQTAEKEAAEAEKQLKNIRKYLGIEKEKQEKAEFGRKHEVSL